MFKNENMANVIKSVRTIGLTGQDYQIFLREIEVSDWI